MNKDQMIEEMKKRGYDVIEDNHVITFKKEGFIEDLIPEIRKTLSEIGYVGTWGVRAISKHPDKRAERHLSEDPVTPYNTDDTLAEEPITDIPKEPDSSIKAEEEPVKSKDTASSTEGLKPEGERVEDKEVIKKESTVTEFKQLSLIDMFG